MKIKVGKRRSVENLSISVNPIRFNRCSEMRTSVGMKRTRLNEFSVETLIAVYNIRFCRRYLLVLLLLLLATVRQNSTV